MSTFWRLLGFLRPYRKGVIWSFVLAFGALGGHRADPVADRRGHQRHQPPSTAHQLVLLAVAITVAGLGRLVLSVYRRLIAGEVSLGVEVDLRQTLYDQLQRLELGVL